MNLIEGKRRCLRFIKYKNLKGYEGIREWGRSWRMERGLVFKEVKDKDVDESLSFIY